MKKNQGWKKKTLFLIFAIILGIMQATPGFSEKKEVPVNVPELRRLLEVARESGFTEKELKEITIEDDGSMMDYARIIGFTREELTKVANTEKNEIIIWEYLNILELRKRLAEEREKAQRERVYLTIQDLISEIKETEPKDLTELRNKTYFKE